MAEQGAVRRQRASQVERREAQPLDQRGARLTSARRVASTTIRQRALRQRPGASRRSIPSCEGRKKGHRPTRGRKEYGR